MIKGKKYKWHLNKEDISALDTVTYTNVAVVKLKPLPSICEPNSSIANGFVEIFDNDGKQLTEIPMAEIDSEDSIGKFAVDASNTVYLIVAKNEKVEVEETVTETIPNEETIDNHEVSHESVGIQTEEEKNLKLEKEHQEHTDIEEPVVKKEEKPLQASAPKTITKVVKKEVIKPITLTLEDMKKKFQYYDVIYKLKDSVKVVDGQFLMTVYDNLKDDYIYQSMPVDENKMMTLMKTLISNSDTSSMGLLKFSIESLLSE